jgi:hypothetical protein
MKKIILIMGVLNSLLCFSQELKTALNEDFKNNINNWNVCSVNKKATVSNGSYNLFNEEGNSSCRLPKNLNLNNKELYEIETNFKIKLSENSSYAGLIFVNEIIKEINMPIGYLILFAKFGNDYYIYLNKDDGTSFQITNKIENFDPNVRHNLKVVIDNTKPKITVFVDSKKLIENEVPLFNFSNIGFYQISKSELIIDNIIVKCSEKKQNNFLYDIYDRVYEKNTKSLLTIKGNYYTNALLKYVPKTVLLDVYEDDFNTFKNEIIVDDKCYNFKTRPSKSIGELEFSFDYESNKFFTIVHKSNLFSAVLISFSNLNDSKNFYNLYKKAKGFVSDTDDRAYYPTNSMKAILLNKDNTVTIFY